MAAILTYPVGVGQDNANFPAWVKFDIFERKSPANSVPIQTIGLYLPENLNNPNTVSWDTERMGFLGKQISNMMANGATLESMADVGVGTAEIMASNALYKSMSALVQGGGGRATAEMLQGDLTGQVRNPFLTMFFRGVDFRTFEMTFKFCPHSESDCELIDTIVRSFRANSLPPGAAGEQPAFLGYPREFQIEYFWRAKRNKYLNRFKRCVLVGVDVNYTGTGQWAVMRNGFPAEIAMTLKFSEIELVLRDDVLKGY